MQVSNPAIIERISSKFPRVIVARQPENPSREVLSIRLPPVKLLEEL
jgi:hypothetical protein